MTNKIKYWWSEDRKWFCVRIKGETVSLTVEEAEELMGEVQQTPSFLVLQEEASQRAVELMEQSRENSTTAGSERIDIVERLRFDATRCELQFSKGVAGNINDAADEIESLRRLIPDVAQPKQETDWLGEAARWANRAYDMKCALDKAANRFRELGYIDFANDCLAAQPPAAPVDGEKAAKDYEHGYNDGIEWAQTHGRSSAGNGDDLSRRARELADEPVIGAEGRKLLRQMATEIEDLRHDIDRHIQIATDLSNDLPQEAPELRLAASRLTDIITMLDAPDAYNREYIAAVCRSVLSSLTRPHGGGQ